MQGKRSFTFIVAKVRKTSPRHYLFIAVTCFLCMAVSSCPTDELQGCPAQSVTVLRGTTGALTNPCRESGQWLPGDSVELTENVFVQGVTLQKVTSGENVSFSLSVASDAPKLVNEQFTTTVSNANGDLGAGYLYLTTDVGFDVTISNIPVCNAAGTVFCRSIYPGESLPFTANVTGGAPPYRYSWSPGTGLSNPTIANPVATPLNNTTYTLTVTDSRQEVAFAVVKIAVLLKLIVSVSPAAVDPGQPVQLAAIVSGGTLPYTYAWNPAELVNNAAIFDPIATPTHTERFEVSVQDSAPLPEQSSASILVPVNLKLTVSATPPAINPGQSSQLLAAVTGGAVPYTYLWSPAVGFSNLDYLIFNPVVTPPVTTAYTVTVTDGFLARAQGVITVSVGAVSGPAARLSLIWLSPITLRADASASTPGSSPIVRYEYTQAWFGDPNQPADVCYYPPGFPSPSISCMQNLENATPWIYDFAGTSGETVRVKVVDANGSSSWTTQVAPPGP